MRCHWCWNSVQFSYVWRLKVFPVFFMLKDRDLKMCRLCVNYIWKSVRSLWKQDAKLFLVSSVRKSVGNWNFTWLFEKFCLSLGNSTFYSFVAVDLAFEWRLEARLEWTVFRSKPHCFSQGNHIVLMLSSFRFQSKALSLDSILKLGY